MQAKDFEQHIGKKVTYNNSGFVETGVITSVNNTYVFVRYGSDEYSKATHPDLLELYSSEK